MTQNQSRLTTETKAIAAVGFLCLVVGAGLKPILAANNFPYEWKDLFLGILIGIVGAIVPILIRHTQFGLKNGAAMPILTVLWRFGIVATAILLSAATKWPLDKSFAGCLLGCYFPFIILESALSVRNVSKDTRRR